ncbi:MAG: dihydrodipicolinate reductase C-terminal domain-containing protein [Bacteroidales bacterium]
MNIALIGYGKMGKTLERMGKERGHAFPLIIDLDNAADLNERKVKTIDVAIEFTQPEAAPANIKRCIDLGVPVVCGTTGWNDQVEEVEIYCLEKKGSMFHASNYSIGVNILFAMNQKLAALMNAFPQYRASMREIHHTAKKDAPSGTAISLAEQIIVENQHINKWKLGKEADEGILPIEAYRQER